MRHLLRITFLILFPLLLHAQEYQFYERPKAAQIDSLETVLKNATNDTLRMELNMKLGRYFYLVNLEIALYHQEQQLIYARKLKQKLWEADALVWAGHTLEQMIEYSKSLEYIMAAIKITENEESEINIWQLEHFTPDEITRNARLRVLAYSYAFLGVLNGQAGGVKRQLFYFDKALKIAREIGDIWHEYFNYLAAGWRQESQNKLDSAIVSQNKSVAIIEEMNFGYPPVFNFMALARIYKRKGKDSLAIKYALKAIESGIKNDDPDQGSQAYLLLSRIYRDLNQTDMGLKYAYLSLETSLPTKHPRNLQGIYRYIIKEYEVRNELDSAFKYQNLLLGVIDTLRAKQNSVQFVLKDFENQTQQQQAADATAAQKAKTKSNALWVGLSIFLLAAVLLYRNNRIKQKSNALLSKQKKEIETTLETLKVTQDQLMEVEKKSANLELNKLKEVNALKNALYTNITHEFRTPLTVIKGMTEAIKSDIENKDMTDSEKSLEMIQRNSDGLLRLVNEMLDLAKLESGNMRLDLVQSDIIPFVKYLGESFHSLAEQKGINLMVYAEIDKLIMDFDTDKLSTIISNVLSNAIKFTPSGGKVVAHLNRVYEAEQSYFTLKIKDNGRGIAAEDLPNIFNRFYQVNSSITREQEGTGIGLALSKELAELMGGTISVKSVIKEGSTFMVQIPVNNTAFLEKEIILGKENLQIAASQNKKITDPIVPKNTVLPLALIIEDNEDVAIYLKTCLKGKYQTLHTKNGRLGIKMALEQIPDIIISDVMMPEKDGFEVCATLKTNELTDHIPIILLTAKATIEDRLKGLSQGADVYLAKPFEKEELFTRLDQLLRLRAKMLRKFENNGFEELLKKQKENPEMLFLQKASEIIHTALSDSSFTTVQMAHKLGLSESQVYRKLKALTGKSTALFIRSIRLQKAKELIQTTDKNISEIAYEVGFEDPSWFGKAFKEAFDISPSALRK